MADLFDPLPDTVSRSWWSHLQRALPALCFVLGVSGLSSIALDTAHAQQLFWPLRGMAVLFALALCFNSRFAERYDGDAAWLYIFAVLGLLVGVGLPCLAEALSVVNESLPLAWSLLFGVSRIALFYVFCVIALNTQSMPMRRIFVAPEDKE